MKNENRAHVRSLCADLVKVEWNDEHGLAWEISAVLEDISRRGACLQTERPIPEQTRVTLRLSESVVFSCRTVYCVYRDIGYYAGVEFNEGCDWSERDFRPQHLLDFGDLVGEPDRLR